MDAVKVLAALVCSTALLVNCNTPGSSSANPRLPREDLERAIRTVVDVFEVRAVPAQSEQLVPAITSVENSAVVLAERGGVLVKLGAEIGARVREGEILGEISGDDLRAQLKQLELEAGGSKVHERQLEALVRVNQSESEEDAELFKAGLVSKRQLERTRLRMEASERELERTRLATQAALARVEGVRLELEKTLVRAPITGIVTRRYATRGTTVVKDVRLFEVSALEPLQVQFQLDQKQNSRLTPGSVVHVSLADDPAVHAAARVRRIDPTADAQSNTLGLLADLIDPRGFIPGAAVVVHVPAAGSELRLRVPRAAFPADSDLQPARAAKLFVLDGDRCSLRTVILSDATESDAVVESGLATGDHVILAPPQTLRHGDPVGLRPK